MKVKIGLVYFHAASKYFGRWDFALTVFIRKGNKGLVLSRLV